MDEIVASTADAQHDAGPPAGPTDAVALAPLVAG
jgi:hypothetical protein